MAHYLFNAVKVHTGAPDRVFLGRAVLASAVRIAPSEKGKTDFAVGVVRITADQYDTTLAVAAGLR